MSYQNNIKAGMWRTILFLSVLTLPFAAYAGNGNGKGNISSRVNNGNHLSTELQALADASTDGYVDVIIQFKSTPQDSDHAAVASEGGTHKLHLDLINGSLYHVPVKALKHLAKNPNVLYITPDRPTNQFSDYSVATIHADIAQSYGYDGTGVGVAVIDSGVALHRDLKDANNVNSRVVYSESFVTGQDATDTYGHGTHVAGIIGGNGASSGGKVHGIAPGASIVNLRVLDGNGGGSDSGVIAAINRAIQLKSQYNIRVINLSLGRRVYESYTLDPLCQAVEQAWQSGIFVAVAAGNYGRDNTYGTNGYATITSPGNDPYVITVGATNTEGTPNRSDDIVASYSSKGPTLVDHIVKPDVVAPGNLITSLLVKGSTLDLLAPADEIVTATVSTVSLLGTTTTTTLTGAVDGADPSGYFRLSGTSMATPMVSGAAALMLQKDPTLTPDQIKARLMKTATKMGRTNVWARDRKGNQWNNQYDIFTVGAGYVDVWAALNNSDAGNGYALSPTANKGLLGQVTLSNGGLVGSTSVIWGNSVIWGSSVVWGGDVVDSASSVIWGNSVIWGADGTSACSVIWGSSVIWGNVDLVGLSGDDPDDSPDAATATLP